jgi:hypothetical protein
MIDHEDIDRLKEIFVTRQECDRDMDEIKEVMSDNKAQFAVITTKLSLIMWLLGAVGSGVIGILIKIIFGG